jgi:hypothetical protein
MDEEIILTEADLEEILSVAAWGEPRGLEGVGEGAQPREGRTGALCALDEPRGLEGVGGRTGALCAQEVEIILTEADLEEVLAAELGEDALLLTEADLEEVLSCGEDAELLEQWFEAGERLASDDPEGICWADLDDEHAGQSEVIAHWLQSLFDPIRPRRLQEA